MSRRIANAAGAHSSSSGAARGMCRSGIGPEAERAAESTGRSASSCASSPAATAAGCWWLLRPPERLLGRCSRRVRPIRRALWLCVAVSLSPGESCERGLATADCQHHVHTGWRNVCVQHYRCVRCRGSERDPGRAPIRTLMDRPGNLTNFCQKIPKAEVESRKFRSKCLS